MARVHTGESPIFDISTVIPFHSNAPISISLLGRALRSVVRQVVRPREVILSLEEDVDVSKLEIVISEVKDAGLNLRIVRNKDGKGIGSNTNNGVSKATSTYVHPLYYDDFLFHDEFYKVIYAQINEHDVNWAVTSSFISISGDKGRQSFLNPSTNKHLAFGVNTIGPPSATIFRRDYWIPMDVDHELLVDCLMYETALVKYGQPMFLEDACVGVATWHGQTQNQSDSHSLRQEFENLLERQPRSLNYVVTAAHTLWFRGNRKMARNLLIAWLKAKTN